MIKPQQYKNLLNSNPKKILAMKQILKLLFTMIGFLAISNFAKSQNQVYWRESFTPISPVTADPGATATPYTYTGDAGNWLMYGTWQTTGTSCVSGAVATGNLHFRSTNAAVGASTPADVEDDTTYMITPAVPYGIQEVHLLRSRNNRRITIWKSSDNTQTTTNWTLVSVIPKSTASPVVLCTDTSITVADPTAKLIRFRLERAVNCDVDSIFLTSFAAIPLAVNFTNIKAYQKTSGVQIDWSISNDNNAASYVVERSADGSSFITGGNVNAQSSSTSTINYSWYDAAPLSGNNFYRIKAVDRDGSVKYTSVMKVNISGGKPELIVSPNPVKGNVVNLQLTNVAKGTYTVSLYNISGQKIFTDQIKSEGGSSSQSLQLPSTVKAGTYNLQMNNGADVKLNKTIVIE